MIKTKPYALICVCFIVLAGFLELTNVQGTQGQVTGNLQTTTQITVSGTMIYKDTSTLTIGVDYWNGFTSSQFTSRDLPFLQEAGITLLRLSFDGSKDTNLATLVPEVDANGLTIIGCLVRSDLVNNSAAWSSYVYSTVSAFRNYVHVWEIWNEPNCGTGFTNNATGYVQFLQIGYSQAKLADSTCTVLGGSLVGTNVGSLNYLSEMYADGSGNYMDALSVHPYCNCAPSSPNLDSDGSGFWTLQNVRNLMVSNGYSSQKIWITEIGWKSAGSGNTEAQQAQYLNESLTLTKTWNWVQEFTWYNWMDDSPNSFGLVYALWNPPYTNENFCKPAFFALK